MVMIDYFKKKSRKFKKPQQWYRSGAGRMAMYERQGTSYRVTGSKRSQYRPRRGITIPRMVLPPSTVPRHFGPPPVIVYPGTPGFSPGMDEVMDTIYTPLARPLTGAYATYGTPPRAPRFHPYAEGQGRYVRIR